MGDTVIVGAFGAGREGSGGGVLGLALGGDDIIVVIAVGDARHDWDCASSWSAAARRSSTSPSSA